MLLCRFQSSMFYEPFRWQCVKTNVIPVSLPHRHLLRDQYNEYIALLNTVIFTTNRVLMHLTRQYRFDEAMWFGRFTQTDVSVRSCEIIQKSLIEFDFVFWRKFTCRFQSSRLVIKFVYKINILSATNQWISWLHLGRILSVFGEKHPLKPSVIFCGSRKCTAEGNSHVR